MPGDVPVAAVRRGPVIESVHDGRACYCNPSGAVLEALGDSDAYVLLRSSAKPLQALPLVLSGAADAFGLTDDELAVACASHNAEAPHLDAVRSILEKAGLSERDLQSGAHPPMYGPAAADLARRGEEPRAMHSNCSGKHAGMLAVCAHEGWTTVGYRKPDHPLQRRIMEVTARVCDLVEDEILVAGDNCGVPTFGMPLRNLATGFARLATGTHLDDDLASAAVRLRDAMRSHPFMVAGTGRLDTEVMDATDLMTKSGAEAVFAAGSTDGWGFAVKVSDGSGRALRPAALAALARRGTPVDAEPTEMADLHGEPVGIIEGLL
jgi:L-asparaginase II